MQTLDPAPDYHRDLPAWRAEGAGCWWPIVGCLLGGVAGGFAGYCMATVELDYPAGLYLGAPVGVPVGGVLGLIGGFALLIRGGINRQFSLVTLLCLFVALAVLFWFVRAYVVPIVKDSQTVIDVSH